MIIVVEGIDRVGKTTLCKMIEKEFDCLLFKDSMMKGLEAVPNRFKPDLAVSSMNTILNMYEALQISADFDIVLDRFHATEYVYGTIERNYPLVHAKEYFNAIEDRLEEKYNYFFILVKPTNLEESSKNHGKDLSMHEKKFEALYDSIPDEYKIKTDFNHLQDTIDELRGRKYESWI